MVNGKELKRCPYKKKYCNKIEQCNYKVSFAYKDCVVFKIIEMVKVEVRRRTLEEVKRDLEVNLLRRTSNNLRKEKILLDGWEEFWSLKEKELKT